MGYLLVARVRLRVRVGLPHRRCTRGSPTYLARARDRVRDRARDRVRDRLRL